MRRGPGSLVLVISLMLAGCSGSGSAGPDAPTTADRLWSARTAYAGDNSRVIALLGAAGFAARGRFTISLRTTKPPYGVTVNYDSLDKPFKDESFEEDAVLALGLVANLDHIEVISPDQRYRLTADQASRALGYDVKDLGQDKSKLAAYLRSAGD